MDSTRNQREGCCGYADGHAPLTLKVVVCSHRFAWNSFKGDVGETSERRGGAHMGFSERVDTVLN